MKDDNKEPVSPSQIISAASSGALSPSRAKRNRRRAMAARLLAERVPHRDVVEQIVQKFEVTAGTARDDLKKIS